MPAITIHFEGGGELKIEREGQKLIRHIAAEIFILRDKPEAVAHWRAEDKHWIIAPGKVVAIELTGVDPDFKLR